MHRMMRSSLPLTILLIICLAALILTSCVPEQATPQLVDPTDFVTYVHPSGVFTLDLPPEWVVSETSSDTALNVEFSPPNSPEPLVGVYVTTLSTIASGQVSATPNPSITPQPGSTSEPPGADLESLATTYELTYYHTTSDTIFKEMGRDPQPDGSLRLRFVVDAPQGTSTHNDFIQVRGPYFVVLRIQLPEDHAQMRTVSRVVNTLTVNEGAQWASADPKNQSANRDVVGFANLNAWSDANSGFEIAGQIVNNAPDALEFIRITAILYDANNNILAQQDDFVSSDLVLPGEFAPFSLLFPDGLPPGTVRYDLNASARYADFTTRTFYGPKNFGLTQDAGFDENGLLVVQGQARNEGNQPANLVKVIVTVFDAEQRVIATDTTLVDQQRLAPGEASAYSVTFVELGGTPNTFLVIAQGIVEGSN